MFKKNNARIYMMFGLIVLLSLVIIFWNIVDTAILPVVFGAILTFILVPLQKRLENLKIKSSIAAMLTLLICFGTIIALITFTLPPLFEAAEQFINGLPTNIQAIQDRLMGNKIFEILNINTNIPGAFQQLARKMFISDYNTSKLLSNITKTVAIVGLIPFYAFFFLSDRKFFQNKILYIIPYNYKPKILKMFKEIHGGLHDFLYADVSIAAICAIFSAIGFIFVGLDEWVFLSILMFIFALIPTIGVIIGGLPALLCAAPYGSKLIVVLIIIIVLQQIAGGTLAPKVFGNSANVHPVLAIFSVFLLGALFGVFGMLFAIPIVIILRVIIQNLFLMQVRK